MAVTPGSLVACTPFTAAGGRFRVAIAVIPPYASVHDREKGGMLCAAARQGSVALAWDMLLESDPVLEVLL